ncbi:MAG: hypothetical protein Q8L57_03960 [bacterium]|nr:hypothetical protein [bacterium]
MGILPYLISRLFLGVYQFFYDWYVGGFYAFWRRVYIIFKSWDREIAFRPTLRHWFQPLFQDYTVLGYILGFLFRTGRIIVGGAGALVIFGVSVIIYFIWVLIPAYIFIKIFWPAFDLTWF